MHKVAVIGAGIIGMTTATTLQRQHPNIKLTVFAKEFSPNTTSDIAAGLWEPVFLKNTPEVKVAEWSAVTYNQLLRWWREGKAQEYGICMQPQLLFTDEENFKTPMWLKHTLGHQKLSQNVVEDMSQKYNLKLTTGFTFITFTWEASIMLPRLQKEFTENGGKIVSKEIQSLNELSSFDVVVNCTGLESRNLVGDEKVEPIRGQIKKVVAPWQFHIMVVERNEEVAYIIPNTHQCTLGGTAITSYETSVDETQRENIERNCSKVVPSLRSAITVKHVVGLRPGRSSVRLESEIITGHLKPIRVVHNYGHGGAGITMALGCAKEAAELVKNMLNKHKL